MISLFYPAVLALDGDSTSSKTAGIRLGLVSVPVAIGSLIGSPIANAIIGEHGSRKWWAGSLFTGVSVASFIHIHVDSEGTDCSLEL